MGGPLGKGVELVTVDGNGLERETAYLLDSYYNKRSR